MVASKMRTTCTDYRQRLTVTTVPSLPRRENEFAHQVEGEVHFFAHRDVHSVSLAM
jgi:expansin (peptidoglycan-binding protein)